MNWMPSDWSEDLKTRTSGKTFTPRLTPPPPKHLKKEEGAELAIPDKRTMSG